MITVCKGFNTPFRKLLEPLPGVLWLALFRLFVLIPSPFVAEISRLGDFTALDKVNLLDVDFLYFALVHYTRTIEYTLTFEYVTDQRLRDDPMWIKRVDQFREFLLIE